MYPVPVSKGEVQTRRSCLVQINRFFSAISDAGGSGDDIPLGEHAIQEFNLDICRSVCKRHGERFSFAVMGKG